MSTILSNNIMLEFKDDPKKLIMELDRFLSIYYGDRQIEYQRDLDEVLSWNIPKPLKYLYPFIEKYLGQHGNLCKQDSLIINSGKKSYGGKILIASENQGCWNCYTDTEGKYCQVEDYLTSQIDSFYLIEDSILLWNSGWCGTNYRNANEVLASIKSECVLNPINPARCQLTDDEDLQPF